MPSIISLSTLTRSRYDKLKKSFSCTNEHLEKYIKRNAFSHQREGLFQTYFYVDDDGNYLGYISLSPATIEREEAEDTLDIPEAIKYSIPAIKITRFCTFDGHCRKGVGKALILFTNILAVIQQKSIGCRAIIVDSKTEAISFYEKVGFVKIDKEENSDTMFMVYDLLQPKELTDVIPSMIEFCKLYKQTEFIDILT